MPKLLGVSELWC